MKNSQNFSLRIVLVIAISCLVLGAVISQWLLSDHQTTSQSDVETVTEPQPLYWVAPMDANYRRDQPGKSPMGMALIPVYQEEADSEEQGPGAIRINPSVVNNLGIRSEAVKFGRLQTQVKTVGYVNYNQDKLVHIHPRVQGWIETLNINSVGDTITKGQAIYSLYSPQLVNAQEEYVLALDSNNTRLINAAKNRLMALQLPKQAIKTLERSRKVQQKVTFYAPQSGVVENLAIREGFFVQPGTTLFSIGDLTEVWVEAEIFERQASFVFIGDTVSMTLDYLPGRIWHGEVDYIYPSLNEKTRTMKIRLRFANTKLALKPNMFAQVIIHGQPSVASILITKEALIRTGTQDRVVLALGEGRFKSVAVKIGRSDGKHIEILSGLGEGDVIVTSAQFLLDSESSKTSDFKRMSALVEPNDDADQVGMSSEAEQAPASARVSGTIKQVEHNSRMVTIDRGAIEKWQRPAATVDFLLAEELDISQLHQGMTIDFSFNVSNGDFTLTTIHSSAH